LFRAEGAIQVRTDADVPGIAGELADVIDMVDRMRQRDSG
jgi:hypothetical protein